MLSAAVIIAVLVALACLDYWANGGRPGIWLVPLALLILGLATSELLGLVRAQQLRPIAWAVYGGTFAVLLAACVPIVWPNDRWDALTCATVGLAFGVGLAFSAEMRRYEKPGGVAVNLAVAVFIMAYLGVTMSFLVGLRLLGDNPSGMAALLSLVAVVKLSDVGAYTIGRAIGRHQMSPRLSPKKTIEGALGGIVAACLASWLIFVYLNARRADAVPTPVWGAIAYGLILALAGMLGDLAESLLKRDSQQKDSSTWLPGLGGVLDVIDSLLAAAPAAYVCWSLGLVGS
jgi:phosphatidate cytidylyltransferase